MTVFGAARLPAGPDFFRRAARSVADDAFARLVTRLVTRGRAASGVGPCADDVEGAAMTRVPEARSRAQVC